VDWEFLLTFVPDMRYASLVRNVGLLMALSVALFVGCKKEKEQNGPSLTVAADSGVVTGDQTLPPGTYALRFKLIAQKGTGKDDADLKEYTITGTNNIVNVRRPAPNGQSFTIDITVEITGANGESYNITFTLTDKNDKSTERRFTIRFRDTTGSGGGGNNPPPRYVDSLLNASYTNQSDNKGTHLRYQVGSGTPLTLQTRSQANNNPSEILFVYWFGGVRHSVISPAILRNDIYNNTDPEWDNPSTQATYFKDATNIVDFARAGHADIINAYNNGAPINNEFQNNADQRAECRTGRILAFKQGNIYGLIRVDAATQSVAGCTLSVKVARP
jgi:hypothetical protein